jgi:hypothetical protein
VSQVSLALNLSVLHARLELDGVPEAARALGAVWEHAQWVAFVPPRTRVVVKVGARAGGGFRIELHDGREVHVADEIDVAPIVEGDIYAAVVRAHVDANLAVLHASCCTLDGQTYVFAGESGAGKSALARAAVDAGFRYFGDEHIVTDGQKLWGLPRSIHMDYHPVGAPLLPWHAGADVESYVFRDRAGLPTCLPMRRIAPNDLATEPAAAAGATLVRLAHGNDDMVAALSAAERLHTVAGAHFVRSPALADVVLKMRARALTWADPHAAFRLLREAR